MKTTGMFIACLCAFGAAWILGGCERPGADSSGKPEATDPNPVVATVVETLALSEGASVLTRMPIGGAKAESLGSGGSIRFGDEVSVAETGSAMVALTGGGQLSLSPGAKMRFVTKDAVMVESGSAWVDQSAHSGNRGVSIASDAGPVSLNGGCAGIRVDDNGLVVSVVSGTAEVKTDTGTVPIYPGQEAVLEKTGPRLLYVDDPGSLVSWSRDLRLAMDKTPLSREFPGADIPSGLGTLSAKAPGSKTELPFEAVSQDVDVRIQDRVAVTTVEQVFRNPTGRVVEGTYKFPLPPNAKLNRYDMEIGGKLMRGEIVERDRGRGIMKTVIRQFVDLMRDPALVEWESGSTFKTRIFPIQPREEKRIVLSYVETLEGAGGKYRYALPMSPGGAKAIAVPNFRIQARVGASGAYSVSTPMYTTDTKAEGNQTTLRFEARDFAPEADFVIQIDKENPVEASLATYGEAAQTGGIGISGIGGTGGTGIGGTGIGKRGALPSSFPSISTPASNYFMLSVAPKFDAVSQGGTQGTDWIFMADTSQSRTDLDLEIQRRLIATLIRTLGPADRVKVFAYDMNPRIMNPAYAHPSAALVEQTLAFFDAIMPAGATDLLGALEGASAHIEQNRQTRVVVLGDGAATLGEKRPNVLSETAARIFNPTGASVTTIGIGSSVDSLIFGETARRTGGQYRHISAGEDLLAASVDLVAGLRVPVLTDVKLALDGLDVKEQYPADLPNIRSGQEIAVSGRYSGTGETLATLYGLLDGKAWKKEFKFNVGEAGTANGYVPLLFASRKIDALTLRGDEEAMRQVVALSKKYSIPSRYTSFIVLENEAMYREFRVARRGDRFEWDGTEDIDYEEGEEDAETLDALSGMGIGAGDIGGLGAIGSGAGGGGLGSAAGRSGGGRASAGPPPVASKSAARPSRPKPSPNAMSELGYLDDSFGGPIGGYERPSCRPGWNYEASAWRVPAAPRDRDLAAIEEVRRKSLAEPLSRKHRRSLVKLYLRFGKYQEALNEVTRWREIDRSNPVVLRYAGDLMLLAGDVEGALRIHSGVLDVKPEDTKTMDMLASYFASKNRPADAYPFRVSRSLAKPDDAKARARLAIAAAEHNRWSAVDTALKELVEQNRTGGFKLKKGVRLPKAIKESVLRIAHRDPPAIGLGAASRTEGARAKFRFELEWDAPVDLDLWVSSRNHRHLGGDSGPAKLIDGKGPGQTELLYMTTADAGQHKIKVICAEPGGCGRVTGKLHIKAPYVRRSIPFTLESGAGTDLAIVQIDRWRDHCGW